MVLGQGLGRISGVEGSGTPTGRLRIRLGGRQGEVAIASADADALLRPVVGAEEAAALLERLLEPCNTARDLPPLRSLRELSRAPLERQVEYVRWHFRKGKVFEPRETEVILVVTEHVVAELALALGVAASDLRARITKGV